MNLASGNQPNSMNMKTLHTALLLIGLGTFQLKAQTGKSTYQNAIGLRVGPTSGVTFKHHSGSHAIEGIVGFWNTGASITGLYEIHAPTGTPGLKWYYGGGGHIAFQSSDYYYRYRGNDYVYRYRDQGVALGVDAIVGIEYKITPIPIAVSLDIKPLIEINNHGNVYGGLDPGLGIKFTF